jgi:hypothetical protein
MLREDRPLLRRLLLERCTLEMAREQTGPFSTEGFRLAGKIERLTSHIEGVEGREPEEFWAEHQPLLQAIPQIEAHFPEALVPLEVYDPARRCRKCAGRARTRWLEDRLERVCRRCGWVWVERPLDSAPEIEETPQPEG